MNAWLTGPARSDFEDATRHLRIAGYVVASPASAPDVGLAESLRWIVDRVIEADVVVVLPGWQPGTATDVEMTLADALDVPVVDLDEALSREPELLLA